MQIVVLSGRLKVTFVFQQDGNFLIYYILQIFLFILVFVFGFCVFCYIKGLNVSVVKYIYISPFIALRF